MRIFFQDNFTCRKPVFLIPSEQIPRAHLVCDIIKADVVPVHDNRVAFPFEHLRGVYDFASEKCPAVRHCRLANDYLHTLCLYSLYYALN